MVRPRLSDAAFFWEQDRKISLEAHAAELARRDLPGQARQLCGQDAPREGAGQTRSAERIGAGPRGRARAAELAKADLMTAMVGEFPELQGIMGRYYAEAEGYPEEVALAIEEHYRPAIRRRCAAVDQDRPGARAGRQASTRCAASSRSSSGRPAPRILRPAPRGARRCCASCSSAGWISILRRCSRRRPPRSRCSGRRAARRGLRFHRRAAARPAAGAAGRRDRRDDRRGARRRGPRSPLDAEARLQALKEFLRLPDAAVLDGASTSASRNILRKSAARMQNASSAAGRA